MPRCRTRFLTPLLSPRACHRPPRPCNSGDPIPGTHGTAPSDRVHRPASSVCRCLPKRPVSGPVTRNHCLPEAVRHLKARKQCRRHKGVNASRGKQCRTRRNSPPSMGARRHIENPVGWALPTTCSQSFSRAAPVLARLQGLSPVFRGPGARCPPSLPSVAAGCSGGQCPPYCPPSPRRFSENVEPNSQVLSGKKRLGYRRFPRRGSSAIIHSTSVFGRFRQARMKSVSHGGAF